ncbi:peroxiredoxin [Rhodovibrio sodomensis]|uniref:Peroxiredoxin n=1 Tax=Rhodovibrio sodomensis TaxID=1088 RepID=A0ABS1DH42_9PROT|nr:peroxiredoxin [Rhodovibrio sodomensis]MBK1669792.1 peroxiredoxin [Rhodovibrio sodomensis]
MTNLHDVDWSQLPAPADDGGADHLTGRALPSLALPATDGTRVDPAALGGLTVLYAYPMTGRPHRALPDGWDAIPGARGCTPQACAFRDYAAELTALGVTHLFGLSTQPPEEQREAAERLHLPFPLISDAELRLVAALDLPTMTVEGRTLCKRLTLIARDGTIVHTFYPVFPPDRAPEQVIAWLQTHTDATSGIPDATTTT